MSYPAELPSIMPMAQCVPTNDLLTGPLGPTLDKMTGAFGGLIGPIVILMFVITAVIVLLLILTRKAAKFIQAGAFILSAGLAIPLAILIYQSVRIIFDSAC